MSGMGEIDRPVPLARAGDKRAGPPVDEKSKYRFFGQWVLRTADTMNKVASAVLFMMMLLTVADVFGRKALDDSILGTIELSEFMLVITVFFALAHTEVMGGHVRVDVVMSLFGERTRAAADSITQLICAVLSLVFTSATVQYAIKMRASGEVSQDLWIPKYPFIYLAALGFAVLSIALFVKFVSALIKAVRP
ncbi:MAG: TRAP transporter small permease [Desulfobacteraceae bacterium]|nr:MAG: TRAP transporter small permease [Desulfobacteraceae bacterium]